MSSLLQDKLDLILSEKQNVILPENIKKDGEILGVTRTCGCRGRFKIFRRLI